jgi:hypothetical protein
VDSLYVVAAPSARLFVESIFDKVVFDLNAALRRFSSCGKKQTGRLGAPCGVLLGGQKGQAVLNSPPVML